MGNKIVKKNVTFLSVMLLTIGSTVGAGIFFKNSEIASNTGSFAFSILAWVISAFAILCIALTLGDLIKNAKHNHLGYIGWIKTFCGTRLYKGFRNFMCYVFLPTNAFLISFYALMSLQDALSIFFENKIVLPWYIVIIIAFVFFTYFQISAVANKRIGIINNNTLTFIKFIPILFVIIGGITIYGITGHIAIDQKTDVAIQAASNSPVKLLNKLPYFGVIASVPAIFFAFDGFYSTAGLFEDMNDPKKFSKALSIGIVIIAFVYVLISLGVMVSSDDGTVIGFVSNFDKTMPGKIVGFIIMFAIFLSVLSILNGYAIYSGEFLFSLIKNNEFIFSKYIQKKINLFDSKKLSLFIYGIFFVIFVLCCTIGVFYFKDVYQGAYYDDQTCGIYQLCDLLSNWTALISFFGIGLSLLGFMIKKYKSSIAFKIYATIAIVMIGISTIYELTNTFYYLSSCITFQENNRSVSLDVYLIPIILKCVTLLAFVLIIIGPFLTINKKWKTKK